MQRTGHPAICHALLSRVGLAHLWTGTTLSDEGIALIQAPGQRISEEGVVMLLLVWRLCNGRTDPGGADMGALTNECRERVVALFHALQSSPAAVDAWLEYEIQGSRQAQCG